MSDELDQRLSTLAHLPVGRPSDVDSLRVRVEHRRRQRRLRRTALFAGVASFAVVGALLAWPSAGKADRVATVEQSQQADGLLVIDQDGGGLEPLTPDDLFRVPTRLPPGYQRCSGVGGLAPDGSRSIRYCRANRIIELVYLTRETGGRPPAEPPLGGHSAAPTEVNGLRALVGLTNDGRRVVQLDGDDLMDAMYIAAPAEEVSDEQLRGILASIPALDLRGMSPRSGRHDLRDVLTGGRLREVLVAAGLRPVPHETGVPFEEFLITLSGAPRAQLAVYPVEGFPVPGTSSLGGYPKVIDLDEVDLLFSPAFRHGRRVRPGLGQAVFTCGRVTFNFLGLEDDADPVVEAARRIIAQVDC